MIGEHEFRVTEWDWFMLQVRMTVMELGGKLLITRYVFRDPSGQSLDARFPEAIIQCYFWCKTTEDLLKKKASRDKHLEFYETWVPSEQERLRDILRGLPTLSKELDLEKHVLFTVLHSYGMGSLPVCHFHEGRVHWEMTSDRIPESHHRA